MESYKFLLPAQLLKYKCEASPQSPRYQPQQLDFPVSVLLSTNDFRDFLSVIKASVNMAIGLL